MGGACVSHVSEYEMCVMCSCVTREPYKTKGLGKMKWETPTKFLEQGIRRVKPCVRKSCLEQKRPILDKSHNKFIVYPTIPTLSKIMIVFL